MASFTLSTMAGSFPMWFIIIAKSRFMLFSTNLSMTADCTGTSQESSMSSSRNITQLQASVRAYDVTGALPAIDNSNITAVIITAKETVCLGSLVAREDKFTGKSMEDLLYVRADRFAA